ncbi:MAG: AsmA family protein, partial [Nitrosomonadales bacterium]|nr:AsmA family protein [Nitrosomonadales bacterium]
MPSFFSKMSHSARIALLALLLSIIGIAACEISGWPFLRAPVERFTSHQLERSIQLGEPFKVRFIGGLRLDLGSLHISAPDKFNVPYLVDANNISLQLRYRDVLNTDDADPLRIKSLKVDDIHAYLVRNDAGEASWQFRPDEDREPTPFPRIETLVVSSGDAVVRDALTQADIKVAFDSQEGSVESKPVSHARVEGMFREHPIQAELQTNGLLPIATRDADAPPMDSEGWLKYGGVKVEFKGLAADILGDKSIRANFHSTGPSLSLVGDLFKIALPTTSKFSFEGSVKKENDLLIVDIPKARVGQSDLAAKFKYDERGRVPLLAGDLTGKRFVLADLAPTFGTRNTDGSVVKAREGLVIPNRPLNLPTLNRFDADIKVNLETVDLGSAFRRPIAPFRAKLTLDTGNLS